MGAVSSMNYSQVSEMPVEITEIKGGLDSVSEISSEVAPESQESSVAEEIGHMDAPVESTSPIIVPGAEQGYVWIQDSEYGLIVEVPEAYQDDIVCNDRDGVPFALYEPTAYEALYIELLGTGGGLVWEIWVDTYDEFYSCYSLDPTAWTTVLPGPEIYMMGRTEEYVYTVRRPSDVQFTEETERAYKEYKKAGVSILKRFLEINEITVNPEWEAVFAQGIENYP